MLAVEIQAQIKNELIRILNSRNCVGESWNKFLQTTKKEDQTVVTFIDLELTAFIKKLLLSKPEYCDYAFYSEEEHSSFSLPAIVLDPIDGTKELVKGIPECVLSLALFDKEGGPTAYIYNPFTGLEITSGQQFTKAPAYASGVLWGMISRSEREDDLFSEFKNADDIELVARGSIANKLGLLAVGGCDFVLSKRPKSLWDIAAGTILCEERGINLYHKGEQLSLLDQVEFEAPLIWCRSEHLARIMKYLRC